MRNVLFVFLVLWASTVWSQEWQHGTVTKQAWLDHGGFYVEIDETQYLFMRDARIAVDSSRHAVPDRAAWLTEKSKVRFLRHGFRIYDLEIIWRGRS